jgi:endoglycosylceramidase
MKRRRMIGLGTGVGAFLSFGFAPLVSAPTAQADELDAALDPIINALSSADPTSGVDPSFVGEHATALAAAATPDLVSQFEQSVYLPLHTMIENWIHSDLGQQIDGFLNQMVGSFMIGDGAAGTAETPDGGPGGWLFGDGGDGWTSTFAGLGGGNGGSAGMFGRRRRRRRRRPRRCRRCRR